MYICLQLHDFLANSTMQAGVPFAVRKRAIDMSQIQTIGTDNLNTTFSGDTHSLYFLSKWIS